MGRPARRWGVWPPPLLNSNLALDRPIPRAVVVMVVQPKERNAFDQRWIHYRLMRE